MAINQYGDLPQIYGMEDQGYHTWPIDHEYHMSTYKQPGMRLGLINNYSDEQDHGLISLRPMQRFIHDQGPFYPQMLHAKTPLSSPLNMYYAQQWPVVELTRNVSPDRSSTPGLSSHTSQCELRSPPAYHPDVYSSPAEYSQTSFPSPKPVYNWAYPTGTTSSHTVVDPRELEIEHDTLEPGAASEDVEEIQDATFEQETNCNQESVTVGLKASSTGSHDADSGIGHSMRDAESVQPVDYPEEPASDSDYIPCNRSKKRKRSSASTSGLGRVSKRRMHKRKDSVISSSSCSTKRRRQASSASKSATKAAISLEDRRPFPCPLAPYGCDSNFVSKNEWKRHVSTQHIKIAFWRCDICAPTPDPKDESALYHNDFNRMDLFRQHLRRMHAQPKDKDKHKPTRSSHPAYPVTEANLADHQSRCFSRLRTPPQHSSCIFCPRNFSGPTSWADRMDHVGLHLEKRRRDGADMLDVAKWRRDPGLERYLLDEGLIRRVGGEWSIGDGRPRRRGSMGSESESLSENESEEE